MRKSIFASLCVLPLTAWSADYDLWIRWADPNSWVIGTDKPTYDVEYRINGGAATQHSTPYPSSTSYAVTFVANSGDTIEARVRTVNQATIPPSESSWSGWVSDTVPIAATDSIATPTSVTIQVTPSAP